MSRSNPIALTIAGFDPSGGAGLIADVRVFESFGLNPTGVITSITFQNVKTYAGAVNTTAQDVRRQVELLLANCHIICAKTGMLPTAEIVNEVARLFREEDLPKPVVDPVFRASTGHQLMSEDAIKYMVRELFPLAMLVTPNILEAETLSRAKIIDENGMRRAAEVIRSLGVRAVLIKGGHLRGDAVDVLDNAGEVTIFREQRIPGAQMHGSGCVLSAAIAAGLGKGMRLEEAVAAGKRFVLDALRKTVVNGVES